jgi:tetratricopeptide (TPR) repeat protein
MERHGKLGLAGRAASGSLTPCTVRNLVLIALQSVALGASPPEPRDLYRAGRWTDAIALANRTPDPDADTIYYAALSMASLKRFDEAAAELRKGESAFPHDKRFPAELAGLAYRDKQFGHAKASLARALKLDPTDTYANDFLGTLYLLDANLPAALKYWNRVGKPFVRTLRFTPAPPLTPLLRERTFSVSEGQIFTAERLAATEANLDRLHAFYQVRFDLLPRTQDDQFDLAIHTTPYAQPLAGWIGRLLPSLSQLPYEAVDLDICNIGQRAIDFDSFGRWDSNKQRVLISLSGPYHENPRLHYLYFGDFRNETWNLLPAIYRGWSSGLRGMALQRAQADASMAMGLTPRVQWTLGGDLTYRDFSNAVPSPFFANGWTLLLKNRLDAALLEIPEHRLRVDGWASLDAGRVFSHYSSRLVTARAGLQSQWNPAAKGDRYLFLGQFQAGRTFGNAPLDQFFMLGMERDNDPGLWFRGLVGTRGGRKGSAPMGREYVLAQTGLQREIFEIPFIRLDAGPFFDTAWTGDRSGQFGSRGAMTAAGVEANLRTVSGIKLRVVYGRDLGGGGAFYTSISR